VSTMPSDSDVRKTINKGRRGFDFTGPPARRRCELEELIVELVARQRRVPSALTAPDGYPSGGGSEIRGGSENTSTESAVLRILELDDVTDPVGAKIVTMLDMLQQWAMSGEAVRNLASEIHAMSSLSKPSVGQTAETCQQEDCTNLATRKGNCNTCYEWLRTKNKKLRELNPLADEVRVVDREVIARRNAPRYISGPWAEEEAS
jgi:hypothetical protein